jgi:hypothetical protein
MILRQPQIFLREAVPLLDSPLASLFKGERGIGFEEVCPL